MDDQDLKQTGDNDDWSIKYLLGESSEDQKQQVEEQYLADDRVLEELRAAERDLIDKYVYGELSATQRKRFEEYFLASAKRRKKLRFAMALKRYTTTVVDEGTQEADKGHQVAWWRTHITQLAIAASILLLLAGSATVWYLFRSESELTEGMAYLKKAYRERIIQVRLTGLDYAPLVEHRGDGRANVDEAARRRAEIAFLNAIEKDGRPEAHHALGRLYLSQRQFEDAITQFETALRDQPSNTQLYSDLGAAFFEKGKRDQAAKDLARSFDYLTKALELNPNLLEALFNRALVLQQMEAHPQAEEAWEGYLQRDSNSKWADEARQSLESIRGERRNKASLSKEEGFISRSVFVQQASQPFAKIASSESSMIKYVRRTSRRGLVLSLRRGGRSTNTAKLPASCEARMQQSCEAHRGQRKCQSGITKPLRRQYVTVYV